MLDVDNLSAGIFIGATIHDVAQVVAAGMLFGPEAGDVSTVSQVISCCFIASCGSGDFNFLRRPKIY
jgi:uncharacterized membrane protein YadS